MHQLTKYRNRDVSVDELGRFHDLKHELVDNSLAGLRSQIDDELKALENSQRVKPNKHVHLVTSRGHMFPAIFTGYSMADGQPTFKHVDGRGKVDTGPVHHVVVDPKVAEDLAALLQKSVAIRDQIHKLAPPSKFNLPHSYGGRIKAQRANEKATELLQQLESQ